MFRSSRLFADINCPFHQFGICERPYCLYRHVKEARDTFGACCKSSIEDISGIRNDHLHAPLNDGTKDDCLHELERINKEIESVRHEVEQEQRRLSRYQTVQVDSRKYAPVPKSETTSKNVDRGSYGLSSCTDFTKSHSRARKYVVDNSKPRTDLEYDPLSNFSADLRSFSSSTKDQRTKNRRGLKRGRNSVPCDLKEPARYQAPLSRSPSPEPLDDSNEDRVLIIDIPPSPDQTKGRGQKPADSVAGKSSQNAIEEVKEPTTVSVLLDSPPLDPTNTEVLKVTTVSKVDATKVYNYWDIEEDQSLPAFSDKKCRNVPHDGSVVDLTGCSQNLRRDCQQITGSLSAEPVAEEISTPASPSATSDHRGHNPQCELSRSVAKMHQQPPPKNSLLYKAPAANSPHKQHVKQAWTTEQTAQSRAHSQSLPPLVSGSLKTSSKTSGQKQSKATVSLTSSVTSQEQTEPAPGSSQLQEGHVSVNKCLSARTESSYEPSQQLLPDAEEVIVIESSSSDEEEEPNYSEMELSDSDPMEECYRIFMEANNEDKGDEEHPDVSIGAVDVEELEVNVTPQVVAGKKRVAHEVKHAEQPVAQIRPQPQVLIPLREPVASGFGSRPAVTSKIQQVQQRASMLTASVKGGQAFVSSTCQRRPDTQGPTSGFTQTLENLQQPPVQNAYLNYIPAVIDVGNNLHFILPDGAFPLPCTSSSNPVSSVLTPITSLFTVKQTHHPPAVTPVQRYRSTAPVLIPALARKPSLTPVFASASSSPAASAAPQAAVPAPAKVVSVKRKLKQQCEAAKDKVPHDVRQRYVNMFTEEFLKTTANVNEAFEKALAEEKVVYNRSMNKLKYLSVAVNALKKLKNQQAAAARNESEVNSQRLKGSIPLNPNKLKGNADDMALHESLKDYILTDERLTESNYPVQHPEKRGSAVLFADNKKVSTDPLKRICCRCGATYSVNQTGKHIRKEECNYHYGKGITKRVPGGVETRYSCCEGVMGTQGCQVFKLHVHDFLSLDGFVSTVPRHLSDMSCPGVYSMDCERCYTIHGLELSRVTVVNSSLQVVYDTFVRPDNEVIDYNTRFSGISEVDVKGNHTSLREVQQTLLSFISADTILIGHGLETDLCLLKLLHGSVVDTSVVFPHRLGPPHKRTLHNLTTEYLRRIIQESVCGHDTAEDAAACMELMLWKAKEDGKLKK